METWFSSFLGLTSDSNFLTWGESQVSLPRSSHDPISQNSLDISVFAQPCCLHSWAAPPRTLVPGVVVALDLVGDGKLHTRRHMWHPGKPHSCEQLQSRKKNNILKLNKKTKWRSVAEVLNYLQVHSWHFSFIHAITKIVKYLRKMKSFQIIKLKR